mgnify:CR=1 FL=1
MTNDVEDADDDVVTLVKSYIDSGTCGSVATGSSCGDSAESYYREFEYNGRRVVVANGIPDHEAEHDQYFVNPNTRCERWTYMSLPLSPSLARWPRLSALPLTARRPSPAGLGSRPPRAVPLAGLPSAGHAASPRGAAAAAVTTSGTPSSRATSSLVLMPVVARMGATKMRHERAYRVESRG